MVGGERARRNLLSFLMASYRNPPLTSSDERPTQVPRFLLIKSTDGTKLSELNPFRRCAGLKSLAGEPTDVTRQRDGSILVEYERESVASKALTATVFRYKAEGRHVEIPITVTPHNALNQSKGVMWCSALEGISNEDCRVPQKTISFEKYRVPSQEWCSGSL